MAEGSQKRIGVDLSAAELSKADAVVIVTDHSQIDYQQIVDDANLVIERATRRRERVVAVRAWFLLRPIRGRRLARWRRFGSQDDGGWLST